MSPEQFRALSVGDRIHMRGATWSHYVECVQYRVKQHHLIPDALVIDTPLGGAAQLVLHEDNLSLFHLAEDCPRVSSPQGAA